MYIQKTIAKGSEITVERGPKTNICIQTYVHKSETVGYQPWCHRSWHLLNIFICIYVYISLYMCVYIYVCVYIYIY
jgi:hypothetical protein